MSEQPGKKIGKYEILKEIGRGGFAVVYKARDPDLDRVVALKVLAPHLTWDPTFAGRFRREARATAKLRHPHIVTIYEVDQDADQLYIAMEHLPGRTLAKMLQAEGAMPLGAALLILEQVADALDYAHGQGVLHRDVKPSNVVVEETAQGVRATLMDFGLVKAMETSESLTSMGTILGSPEYMAPEQADPDRKSEIGPATDRYALGVVAYEMLTGRVPFPGSTPSTLVAHMQKAPPDPQGIHENVPASVAQILLKALAKKGEERHRSASEMVEALREAMESGERTRRQEQQLHQLYGQLREVIESQDWATAEARCREILALEPEYRDVPELWVQVREARAHQQELEDLYQAAQAKVESGAWAETKELCQKIESLQPSYRDVSELLRKAEEGLHQEEAQKEHRALLAKLYEQAQTALARERWKEVKRVCAEIEALEPGYRNVERLRAAAEAAMAGEPAVKRPSPLPERISTTARPESPAALKRKGIPGWAWVIGGVTVVGLLAAVVLSVLTDGTSAGVTKIREKDGSVMVYVPTGKFWMGSDESDADTYSDEEPQHEVHLDAFWIDRTEVTNGQYRRCVADGACSQPSQSKSYTRDSYYGNPEFDDYPVIFVDWNQADTYCTWAGGRLPTEAEWEKAARGNDRRTYPWGEGIDCNHTNYSGCVGDTAKAGSYPAGASFYGALDMAGNVWEWVADWYAGDYYANSPGRNPRGPASSTWRVVRGGSWRFNVRGARTTRRGFSEPSYAFVNGGFRCARSGSGS